MKRTVTVEASVTLEFEVDDEVVSEWDGATVLNALEKRRDNVPPVYREDATQEQVLGGLGVWLCQEWRGISSIDGWADFPDGAASGNPNGIHWTFEWVEVS